MEGVKKNKYRVIKDNKVIGNFDTFTDAWFKTQEQGNKLGTFFIQECLPNKVSPEQFISFIDRSPVNPDYVQGEAGIKSQNWANIRSVAEGTMRELREMLKGGTKKEKIVLNELIELKKKALGLIYNYKKQIKWK